MEQWSNRARPSRPAEQRNDRAESTVGFISEDLSAHFWRENSSEWFYSLHPDVARQPYCLPFLLTRRVAADEPRVGGPLARLFISSQSILMRRPTIPF